MGKESRKIGPYGRGGHVVSEHIRAVTTRDDAGSASQRPNLRGAVTQLVVPSEPTATDWWATSELNEQDIEKRSSPYIVKSMMSTVKITNLIDPETGEGRLRGEVKQGGVGDAQTIICRVEPGAEVGAEFIARVDYRRANLPDATFAYHTSFCDFRGARLNRARFGVNPSSILLTRGSIRDTSFDGASCVDTKFTNIRFLGEVNFRGADLTGADFSRASIGAMLAENGQVPETVMDFTDSNLTGEQLDRLVEYNVNSDLQSAYRIIYETISVEDACEQLGVTAEELGVLIWAQDVEVRDNVTHGRVRGSYNVARHHIPVWGLHH